MKNIRKVRLDGYIKWLGSWYQVTSNSIDAFIDEFIYVDDCYTGTLDIYSCSWLRKHNKQFVMKGRFIGEAK